MIRKSRTLRICVLAGGDSPERTVSLASGRSVARSLVSAGHTVSCIDPRPMEPSSVHVESDRNARIEIADADFQPVFWDQIAWSRFDVCFLALHGGAGEDGRLQQYLERRGVAFTGPTAASARMAMSKSASKERFLACGVPTPEYRKFFRDTPLGELLKAAARMRYPLVCKPDAQGSSLGVTLVTGADQLIAAASESLKYDSIGILESFIDGREFTVAVLGREPLPIVEVCSRTPIFSYAEKYDSSTPHYRFDTDLPPDQERAIVEAAVAAAAALETDGLVRVDLRLDGRGRPWVLELNATPGMTETSLAPAAARRAGLEMPELYDLLLGRCLEQRKCA